MKSGISAFSNIERLGIVLMVAGISMGFYGRLSAARMASRTTQNYSSQSESETLSGVKDLVHNISVNTAKFSNTLQLEGFGKWWFFSGLAIFTISRRSEWNKELQKDYPEQNK